MKKTFFFLSVIAFTSGIILTGCQSSEERSKNSQDKIHETKNDLKDAQQYLNQAQQEYLQFKKESEKRICAHEKSIVDFKAKIATEKRENNAIYEMRLAVLEQKNIDLKKKLEEYKDAGNENWDKFRTEFNHDMDKLGQAFKDLTVNNVK